MPDELESMSAALETERRLRAQATADLQEFTSKVCHDLREPLRTVSVYCQMISKTSAPDDPEAARYLQFIEDGVDRAQSLMSAMLEYTIADYERRHQVHVDMNAVYREAARRVTAPPPEVDQRISADPLPPALGDFQALSKVMRHLLDNAVKFNDRKEQARVHVSARKNGSDPIFSVRDNGPGIDPLHHDRIFGLFKRLHGREYPGHGLGLAFCKKTIEWHGGRIWVESKPGDGATFYFSLPSVD